MCKKTIIMCKNVQIVKKTRKLNRCKNISTDGVRSDWTFLHLGKALKVHNEPTYLISHIID